MCSSAPHPLNPSVLDLPFRSTTVGGSARSAGDPRRSSGRPSSQRRHAHHAGSSTAPPSCWPAPRVLDDPDCYQGTQEQLRPPRQGHHDLRHGSKALKHASNEYLHDVKRQLRRSHRAHPASVPTVRTHAALVARVQLTGLGPTTTLTLVRFLKPRSHRRPTESGSRHPGSTGSAMPRADPDFAPGDSA